MDPFLLKIPPNDCHRDLLPHEGEEFLLVLSGRVDFEYDQQTYSLHKGDSLYFDATIKHRVVNRHAASAKLLCVFYGQNEG
jgi:quercetin dioxygenase-like cupin family protein